jgi:hypothetical protein
MWVVSFFVSYLALALIIPTCWALAPVWRRARHSRRVDCPGSAHVAMVDLDPWYAVRMSALGNPELRVKDCSRWPERSRCGQDCLVSLRTQ